MARLLIFCCLLFVVFCEERQSRLARLSQGLVRGYKDPEEDIYIFYNIPYATTPTGRDRFKAPLPPPTWDETFEAVDRKIICPQSNYFHIITNQKINTLIPKDDCLVANVYVPETKEDSLPVVVFVHGGAFSVGWGDLFTPKKVVSSKRIIAVTFNYRLGVHGFLCLGTKDVPGNAGMKDQVALLRWVQNNIASFGGNPDDVTISGYSAGSTAVDLLSISKMAAGLFKKVIAESGANTASIGCQSDPIKHAKIYAKMLNFHDVDDFYALEDFYKTVPYDIMNSADAVNRTDSSVLMTPCVERDVGEERFLDDSPVNILRSGNFPKYRMLYGFTDKEGSMRIIFFDAWKHLMNDKFSNFLPNDLQFKDLKEREAVAERIKRFYFGDGLIENEHILPFVDLFSDIFFVYPMLRTVKYQVKAGNDQIYMYEYSFIESDTPVIPYTNIRGAPHCAQTATFFDGLWNGTEEDEKRISKEKQELKKFIREIWLNFITTGKPTATNLPNWPPVGADWSPYMALNKTVQLKSLPVKERVLLWDDIYDKYYRYPVAPNPPRYQHSEL
ncbi:unnamed protein product [Euphydryas editha]|uniref:Carboxylic ester hydrolase n=1 Tax=Euphydryas editha TaxID=104508 RepID=A0AAU9UKF6_EUPED|nr:unnamed protein product [Euphydryas editha]